MRIMETLANIGRQAKVHRFVAPGLLAGLVPVLGLFLVGVPVDRGTIKTLLVSWLLMIVAAAQFLRYFRRTLTSRAAVLQELNEPKKLAYRRRT
jgi:hypothetical protein